jgi:hypothetical protein
MERLGDALADAGAGPRDDDHGVAEVETADACCLWCHRATSSQVVNQTPLSGSPGHSAGIAEGMIVLTSARVILTCGYLPISQYDSERPAALKR